MNTKQKTPNADHTIWSSAQQFLDFFLITTGSGFFENLKAKQHPVPVSSEVFRIKEPTYSFLKNPQRITCYAEGYLISSEIFWELWLHVNKNIIDIWVVLVDVCGDDVWLRMWILCIFCIGEGPVLRSFPM